jgi:hypothetical protein
MGGSDNPSGTMPVTDDEFIERVVAGCQQLGNARSSQPRQIEGSWGLRPDSGWDFALCYPEEIDPRPFEDLGWLV